MEKYKIIQKFKSENLAKKAGCNCKKKSFAEGEMENPCGEPGYVAYGTKIKDGVEVPNCIPDPDEMKKVVKEGFPIPSPQGGEDENAFISRCVSEITGEYGQEVALGICYSTWRDK
jgi:hypothetical protein